MPKYSRICLVGNGPSTKGMGEEIDSWPFVLRMNKWKQQSAVDVGEKLSALAWFGGGTNIKLAIASKEFAKIRGVPPEHWFTLPPSRCKPRGMGWPPRVKAMAGGCPIKYVTEAQWQREYDYVCDGLSRLIGGHPGVSGCAPTTGFTALSMAIAFGAKHLLLVGYDATLPRNKGWHDARSNWVASRSHVHGHIAEKYWIRELCDNKRWLGRRVDVDACWKTLPVVRKLVDGLRLKPASKAKPKHLPKRKPKSKLGLKPARLPKAKPIPPKPKPNPALKPAVRPKTKPKPPKPKPNPALKPAVRPKKGQWRATRLGQRQKPRR